MKEKKFPRGQCLRKYAHVSQALRGKIIWKLAKKEDKEWVRIYRETYLQGNDSILIVENPPYGFIFWNGLMNVKHLITKYVQWEIGSGENTFFWKDS